MKNDFIITDIKRIVLVGKEEYKEMVTSFTGKLSTNELIYHFFGDATVFFGEHELFTERDTVRFLPKGDFSRYDVVRKTRGECIDICFDADRTVSEVPFVISAKDKEKLAPLFKRIFSVWVSKDAGYRFECISLLYKIFAELERSSFGAKSHFEKIKPAIYMISERFLDRNITIHELAMACGISEAYLKRLFNERYGVPPKQYIIRMRLNYAEDLLRSGIYSVTKVAQMSGFSDIYFFSRQFSSHVGMSPSEFAKKYVSSK
ncbi:MAG: helix-turn-helix transcriptional regulator [Clostridia bacterium]|nr:helix-turn-helix transcriptional regulator [Clostridia bacterium]MBR2467404.1 helix-turn-helix transcriptional regulator [Clostridia bacterium]MBR3715467.1 helix-turn-helix transcriptional regulator [Clostridia bacterium]